MLSQAGEAAKALLSTMLGDSAPLKFSTLQAAVEDELRDDVRSLLGVYPTSGSFGVLLDPEWLPLIAGLKLGVQTRVGDEDYEDISLELAGLFVAAVQSHFSSVGVDLNPPELLIKAPGNALDQVVFQKTTNKLPFFMEWEGAILHGFVLVDSVAVESTDEPADTYLSEQPESEIVMEKSGSAGNEDFAAGLPPSAVGSAPASAGGGPSPDASDTLPPGANAGGVRIQSAGFPDLGPETISAQGQARLGLLAGVELEVTVELGRRRMPLADILRLTSGSVLELDKLVGEPLQVFANNRLIAEGEAVVIDEQFGVRITALAARATDKLLR
ncbi:MAG: flagellar motor switch protein FliN [Rhodothermales bacterium]|nr:flagellar motor switch protein FliN [Rhodothermales bacterium]